jgi:lipoprotein-anchoring transpeptidase ErfK/SrfK
MWKVGDRVVVTQGIKASNAFETKAKGTVIAIDAESAISVLVEIDGTGITMWFYEDGDDLIWGRITCTRAKKRKNNYY